MEMSRQRLRPGMLEASTTECQHCQGTGLVRSDESLALTILRDVEEEGVKGRSAVVSIKAPVSIANFLLNHKRDRVLSIEDRYNLRIVVDGDPHLLQPNYTLEKMKEDEAPESLRRVNRAAIKMETSYDDSDVEDATIVEDRPAPAPEAKDDEDRSNRRGKRGGRGRKKTDDAPDALKVIDLDDSGESEKPFQYGDKPKEDAASKDGGDDRRGRRGQRGGRKRNERTERGKLGNREMAEAAATSMLSGRDALDDAMPDLFSEAKAPAPSAATKPAAKPDPAPEEAPKPKRRRSRKPDPVVVEAEVTTDAEPEVVAITEVAAEKPATIETPVAPEPVADPAPAPTPEPEPVAVETKPAADPDPLSVKAAPTPPKNEPKKRGWWSRG